MAEPGRRPGGPWRRPAWLILAVVGCAGAVAAAVWLWRLTRSSGAPAGGSAGDATGLTVAVIGMLIAVAQVVISVFQLRREERGFPHSHEPTGGPEQYRPGMVSLAPPEGLLDARVRGRDALIDELTRLCVHPGSRAPRVQVLHGMGGCGKTTVALAVARAARTRGVTVWWVSAATAPALETGMRQLLRRLGSSDQELRREWADGGPDLLWRRLRGLPGRWLLIVDNADDTRLLAPAGETVAGRRGWIRPVPSRRGAILVTSRDGEASTWGAVPVAEPWCRLHRVGILSDADSAQILLDRAGTAVGTPAEAARLGARLGGLALALRLAGAYLADTNRMPLPGAVTSFAGYRETLDGGGLTAVFDGVDAALDEEAARGIIDQTWELSLDLLARRHLEQARPLLRLLATFADATIPYRLVLDPAILGRAPMFPGLDDPLLRRLLHGLADLSLIDLTESVGTAGDTPMPALRLHPLIRDACRGRLVASGEAPAYLATTARLLAGAAGAPGTGSPDDPLAWPAWAALTPHVLRTFHAVAGGSADDNTLGRTVAATTAVARYLAESGLYPAARDLYAQLRQPTARVLGGTHLDTLTVQANHALWTGYAGDAAAARDRFAALVSTMDETFGPDHPGTLAARANLADWTGHAGAARTARDLFAVLLPAYERIVGPEHPDTLAARANLAWWTGVAGDASGAREQFAALLPLRRRILGTEHPGTLTVRANLALWTGASGDAVAALHQYSELLPVFAGIFGVEHPSTLAVRANLARWTGNAGQPASALAMYADLGPVVERVLGGTHPSTLVLRANLALWTGATGDPAGALRRFRDLLPERVRVSGADHLSTLVVRVNLAYWAVEAGVPVAADERSDLRAATERMLGVDHPTTVALRAQLARPPAPAGQQTPPAPHPCNALIPIVERILGAEHPRTMTLGPAASGTLL